MNQNKKVFQLKENNLSISAFDGIRMLLSHIGFLNPFRETELSVFENDKTNNHLHTTINLLDAALGRFTLKYFTDLYKPVRL